MKRTQREEGVSQSSSQIHPQNLLPAAAASADEDAQMSHNSLQGESLESIGSQHTHTVEWSEKEVGMRKKITGARVLMLLLQFKPNPRPSGRCRDRW